MHIDEFTQALVSIPRNEIGIALQGKASALCECPLRYPPHHSAAHSPIAVARIHAEIVEPDHLGTPPEHECTNDPTRAGSLKGHEFERLRVCGGGGDLVPELAAHIAEELVRHKAGDGRPTRVGDFEFRKRMGDGSRLLDHHRHAMNSSDVRVVGWVGASGERVEQPRPVLFDKGQALGDRLAVERHRKVACRMEERTMRTHPAGAGLDLGSGQLGRDEGVGGGGILGRESD